MMNDAQRTMLRGDQARRSVVNTAHRLGSRIEPQNVASFNQNALESSSTTPVTGPLTPGEPSAKRRKLSASDALLINTVTRAGETQQGPALTPETLVSDSGSPSLESPLEADEQAGSLNLNALLRPVLPWFKEIGSVVKKAAPPAQADPAVPFREKAPQNAPHFSPKQIAGYYPWTGTGPEDRINGETCKSGWFEKPQHSECQNAYATYPLVLKNATKDLTQLSDFLTNALTIRQENARFEVHGEFKPPPRVTLTDGKREAWLRDLSTNDVPLRRLGRTIPHGVRGKAALEQCLEKSVSLQRALWLVQCIGANELRGFRRKGISAVEVQQSEAKWIQDWSVEVIGFFGDVLARKGEDNWRTHLVYAIRLVQGLLKRHLLDSPAFLSWLIERLEGTTVSNMPEDLLLIEIFWKSLTKWRRLATKVLKVLTRMHTLVQSVHRGASIEAKTDQPPNSVVESSHKILLELEYKQDDLAKGFSTTFVQTDLTDLITLSPNDSSPEMMSISSRREALFLTATTNTPLDAESKCYELLDRFELRGNLDSLAISCWGLWHDPTIIAKAIISWSISRYRLRPARVYIGARLLRLWALKDEIDLTPLFCELLETTQLDQINRELCLNLIAVLVRSSLFDLPRYMQWLVVRGLGKDPMIFFMHQVLVNVPVNKLSIQSRNLRSILLKNAAVPETPAALLAKMQSAVHDVCFASVDSSSIEDLRKSLVNADVSSLYVVVQLLTRLIHDFEDKLPSSGLSASRVSSKLMQIVDLIVELLPDLHFSALLLFQCIEYSDLEALTAIAKLIAQNADFFIASASLEPLVKVMMQRLGDFTHRGPEEKPFITYLYDILCYMDATKAAERLSTEIKQCDIDDGIFGTSPISEEMAEAMEQSDTISWTKLEALLSSGTVMEKPTMEKVFNFLTSNLKSCLEDAEAIEQYGNALARLKTFNVLYFTASLMNWLKSIVVSSNVLELFNLIRGLVATGCVPLRLILVTFTPGEGTAAIDSEKSSTISSSFMAILLGLVDQFTKSEKSKPGKAADYVRAYRIEHQRQQFLKSEMPSLFVLLEQGPILPQELCLKSEAILTELSSIVRASGDRFKIESQVVDLLKRSSIGKSCSDNPLLDKFESEKQAARSLIHTSSLLSLEEVRLELRLMDDLQVDSSLTEQSRLTNSNLSLLYRVLNGIAPEMFAQIHTRMMNTALSQFEMLEDAFKASECSQIDEPALHLFAEHANLDTTVPELVKLAENCAVTRTPAALNFGLRVMAAHHKLLSTDNVPQGDILDILRTLCAMYLKQMASSQGPDEFDPTRRTLALDLIAIVSDCLTPESLTTLIAKIRILHETPGLGYDSRLGRVLGYDAVPAEKAFLLVADIPLAAKLQPESRNAHSSLKRKMTPYQIRRWEVIPDAGTSTIGRDESETCIPLRYFGARKAVLDS